MYCVTGLLWLAFLIWFTLWLILVAYGLEYCTFRWCSGCCVAGDCLLLSVS